MTYASVEFPADRTHAVDLLDDGWRPRGEDIPHLGSILDHAANLAEYGPADGDPVVRAADVVAALLGGMVTFVRTPDPILSGSVY